MVPLGLELPLEQFFPLLIINGQFGVFSALFLSSNVIVANFSVVLVFWYDGKKVEWFGTFYERSKHFAAYTVVRFLKSLIN